MNAYEEKQVFQFRWIFFPIALFSLLPVLLVADGKEGKIALLITGVVLLLTGWLLLSMKQVIRIDANGISYKQGPFHRKFHQISWGDIQNWEVTKISPFSDFGGWGIRLTGKKKGYIIDGEYGLELAINAKKIIVFSIIDKIGIEKAINQYKS
ncbi:MAG: hypothetical protein AB8G86_14160 [Saprospiraceae bacterium]